MTGEDIEQQTLLLPGLGYRQVIVRRRTDGRHIRLTNGRRHRPVGRYASIKNGWSPPWESRVELKDMYHAEVDTNVIAYQAQPETLIWQIGGKTRSYTPDRSDTLVGGTKRIIEIKDSYKPERDPDYAQKLREVEEIYTALGVAFQIRDRAMIEREPFYSAIEEVQAYRRTVVTHTDVRGVRDILRDEPRPLARVMESISAEAPRAKVFAMVVRRIVSLDLSVGLRSDSLVSLVEAER